MLASPIDVTSPVGRRDAAGTPIPTWLRVFLLANVVEDAATGLSGLIVGDRILAPLHVTPLNGRFVGALYVAGGVGILLAAFSSRLRDARPILVGFLLIVVLVEIVTLVYWSDFTRDGVPVVWLVTYTVDPLVLGFAFVRLQLWRREAAGRNAMTPLLLALAVIFAVTGVALVIGTGGILGLWPWKLPALIARVYASFFLALGAAALTAARQTAAAARPVLASLLALPLLAIVASLFHLDRLRDGGPTAAWFAGAATVALMSAAAVARR